MFEFVRVELGDVPEPFFAVATGVGTLALVAVDQHVLQQTYSRGQLPFANLAFVTFKLLVFLLLVAQYVALVSERLAADVAR